MSMFVGLDVSQKITAVCIVDQSGRTVSRGSVPTHPDAIAAFLSKCNARDAKIGMETGPLAVWLFHALKDLGLDVDCIHAQHVHAALSVQLNKTDKNDAHGIASLVRSGWYKATYVKSLDCHHQRLLITSRDKLVRIRVAINNQIRGLLKTFGVVLSGGRNELFRKEVEASSPTVKAIRPIIAVLLESWRQISAQIRKFDRMLEASARDDAICRLLTSIPGVGTLTAISFKTAIGDPKRFARVSDVGAYLGLTPKAYQSGEVNRSGAISRHGNRSTRSLLFEASSCLLTR